MVAERIRVAAGHLKLSASDLRRIFIPHDVFEAEMSVAQNGRRAEFILVETYHHIQGMVGKGALKLVFPQDLLGEGPQFRDAGSGAVEVMPVDGSTVWPSPAMAEERVRHAMREFMTGETLSMSLKSQATGAPFAGSEGLVLCAFREFQPDTGRYFLRPAMAGGDEQTPEDKELIELMLNQASEMLTRAGRIGFDRIVHAAETNSTLTARLDLQLPVNVVEGHLRALLRDHPGILIGDDDMTARLRGLLDKPGYKPTECILARGAARMQMEHSVLLSSSREKLRKLLAELPPQGTPSAAQYRDVLDLFFGRGETQQTEDQLYSHRESILRILSVALSARSLDDCGEPDLLAYYLRTLLDNQRITLEAAVVQRLQGQPLPLDWFERAPLLARDQERRLWALFPTPGMTRDKVKENFWEVVNILAEAKAELPRYTPDPHLQARKEVLERATRAITSAGEVIPSSDRIIFFTLPYAYECVTPRLGVVTRKPVSVCGSELRPEGMAAGGVMSVDILLKKLSGRPQPLQGLTMTIEGLGNAGKHVATSAMQRGTTILGVSDSKGALLCPDGFTREELAVIIAHKNAGRRLNTLLSSPAARGFSEREGHPIAFLPEPEQLHRTSADILVLAAIPGTVHRGNAPVLNVKVLCELTGAAVSGEAKRIVKERGIHVIPDNLASSGGLLVSLYEMLQNSAGQNWNRKLEETRLYQQLAKTFDDVLALTKEHQVDVPTASDVLALRRMHDLAVFREQLEAAACALKNRLSQILPGEPVLIVSDEDEDGVASAAILHTLISGLNPGAEQGVEFLSESLRSEAILERVHAAAEAGKPFRWVFVLDRALPASDKAQARLTELARTATLTIINNNWIPPEALEPCPPGGLLPGEQPKMCAGLNILFISPQTLRSAGRARQFSTALTLRELSRLMLTEENALARIDWQAAVASCLDVPDEPSSEWVWFFTQFNPDRTLEAARAVRMVTRAGGFLNAVHALVGVLTPDQLETNLAWKQFVTEYRLLNERIQVLVDKIVVENRSRPFTAHFFTPEEVASPTPVAGNASNELDLYHWISEHLTRRDNLSEKPILVGQLVRNAKGQALLGVRIRSPRGVDLMEVGLPKDFQTGGLPHTAIARLSLAPGVAPELQFQNLVDEIWMKTTNPIYFAASAGVS
jgi:glutamate dehydrogenase/leucine dehydrogenase